MYFRAKVLLSEGLKKRLKETSQNTPVSIKHFKSRFITSTLLSQIRILSSGFMYQYLGLLQQITRNLSCLTELTVFCRNSKFVYSHNEGEAGPCNSRFQLNAVATEIMYVISLYLFAVKLNAIISAINFFGVVT